MKRFIALFFMLLLVEGYSILSTKNILTIDEPVFLATKGNPPGAAERNFDDSSWTPLTLPTNLRAVLGEAEDYWIRYHLFIPSHLEEPLALSAGFIYTSDAFYLNGKHIGGHGIFPVYENTTRDVMRFYVLFPYIPGQTNVLAWHIKGNQEGYTGMGRFPIKLGPVTKLFQEIYSSDLLSLFFLITYATIVMYFFLFFLRRPSEKDYLAFAVFLLALIVYSFTRLQIKFFLSQNYRLWHQIEYYSYYLLFPLFLLFILTTLQDKSKVGKILLTYSLLMGIPGYVIAFTNRWDLDHIYNYNIYQIAVFPVTILYVIFDLFRFQKKNINARFFLLGFAFVFIAIIHDTLVARGVILTRPIAPFAFAGFILFFALVLANRFLLLHQEIEELNVHLEEKVAQRTKELEESNAYLLQMQKLIQFELDLAQRIQKSMMPSTFDTVHPIAICGTYMPMEELGGDFYDVYKTEERYLHLILADVSGHGVPSALIAMMAKAFLNYYSEHSTDPAYVVQSVNKDLCRQLSDVENYLTLFYAVVDTVTNTCRYINAGHVNVFHLTKEGKINVLSSQTPFLGKFEDITFTNGEFFLTEGDKLIIYSDGITETRNEEGKLFGEGHFMDLVAAHSNKDPETLVTHILEELERFRGSVPYSDDISLLIVQFPMQAREVIPQEDMRKLYEKALMSYRENHLEETEKLLSLLLDHQSLSSEDTYRIYILAGNLAYQQNKWKEAYHHWKKALGIHPDNSTLQANVASLEKKFKKDS